MKPSPQVVSTAPASQPGIPTPTLQNVHYGEHERQVLDFWKAPGTAPTPVVFYIHGGGWLGGDKSRIELPGGGAGIEKLRAAGISVVSISYRYVVQTPVTELQPRVKLPLDDAARGLQFVRSKAAEWKIDPERIGVTGGSAGACSALWLTFHRDLADPKSSDPVARMSSRPWCAAVMEAQTSLDPLELKEWTPNSRYGGHAFGFAWDPKNWDAEFADFYAHRAQVLPWIQEYSPYALATPDAPPVYLFYGHDVPALGQEKKDPTHTANQGAKLKEKLDRIGVTCELVYPGAPQVQHADVIAYFIDILKAPRAPKAPVTAR
ncbi:MAG: alpha/beta hydrolase [Phycisphaerae bacterium]